uniref:Uncharacterized protein n=1 Tax=Anguilla anguilla TaxID=7936 RepID=A0A0E9V4I9_ANGAN
MVATALSANTLNCFSPMMHTQTHNSLFLWGKKINIMLLQNKMKMVVKVFLYCLQVP